MDRISEFDLDVYNAAWSRFNDVLSGRPSNSPADLAEEVRKAKERFEKRAKQPQEQPEPVTPKELGWEE